MKLTGGTRNFDSNVHVHGYLHCVSLIVDDPVNLTGNIETASALETARTISLSGGVTGSVSFDGSANVDIVTTLSSHDHDDRYHTETELDAGQLDNRYYTETEIDTSIYTKTEIDNTFLPLTGGVISVDLTITGNLTVNGITTTINTTELLIEDNLITVNSTQTGTPSSGLLSGIEVERGDETNYHFLFRESDDTFIIGESGSEQPVATREDSPVSFGVTYWDATAVSLITLANSGTDGKVLTSNGVAAPTWETAAGGGSTVISGSSEVGALQYNGLTPLEGTLHGGASSPIGVEALNYNGYFHAVKIFNAVYNDIAEFMYFDRESQPGDVLLFRNGKVSPSEKKGMKNVIGVHSDTFGYGLGAENIEKKIPVGLTGRVNVRIQSPCKEGDLLISSKNGCAVKKPWWDFRRGIIIGKVLKDKKDSTLERISMLIMTS